MRMRPWLAFVDNYTNRRSFDGTVAVTPAQNTYTTAIVGTHNDKVVQARWARGMSFASSSADCSVVLWGPK